MVRVVAHREAIGARLHQYLGEAFAHLPPDRVRRNPGNPLQINDETPALDCFDGNQAPVDSEATPPEIKLRMEWDVEGWVSTEQPEDLTAALNELHASVVEAMTPSEEIPLETADGSIIGIWVEEGQMAVTFQNARTTEKPTASFLQEFRVEVTRNRGQAFVDLPDPD